MRNQDEEGDGMPIFKAVGVAVSQFFGLDDDNEEADVDETDGVVIGEPVGTGQRRTWLNRRIRLAQRKCGGVKDEFLRVPGFQGVAPGVELARFDDVDGAVSGFLPLAKKPLASTYLKDGFAALLRKTEEGRSRKRSFEPKYVINVDIPSHNVSTEEVFFDSPDHGHGSNQRIPRQRLENLRDNSNRRYGMGFVGNLFKREIIRNRRRTVRQQLDEMEDYRPMFTYWITFVQTLIVIISLARYGFSPFNVEPTQSIGFIMTEKMVLEQVSFFEATNFWGGPRPADLIRLGAKFSPCMRYDPKILTAVRKDRIRESRRSGCCVRRDGLGCYQTYREHCPNLLSNFHKRGYYRDGAVTGPVCGQDPDFCLSPASVGPNEWSSDISEWPVCTRARESSVGAPDHMSCRVIARPCCIGIHGRCEIVSPEHCLFVSGHFHPEATLCSQVSCMGDVCGMLSFGSPDSPDQVYRLWTPIFLHAGLIHLGLTYLIHGFLMRDMERLCGPVRMSIIYLGSGIVGNAASSIFVPHRAESGPSGAQFGLLAAMVVEVANSWPMLKHPCRAMSKLVGILMILLVAGLLPWVDNFGHIFGFIGGLFLSFCFMPYLTFGNFNRGKRSSCSSIMYTRRGRFYFICINFVAVILLLASLLSVFYLMPNLDCEICKYFSCIPISKGFCADQEIDLGRRTS